MMKRKGRRERSKVRVSRIFLFSIFDQELTSLEAKGGAAGWKESRNVDKFASNEIGNNRRICSVRRLPCRWGEGGGIRSIAKSQVGTLTLSNITSDLSIPLFRHGLPITKLIRFRTSPTTNYRVYTYRHAKANQHGRYQAAQVSSLQCFWIR